MNEESIFVKVIYFAYPPQVIRQECISLLAASRLSRADSRGVARNLFWGGIKVFWRGIKL